MRQIQLLPICLRIHLILQYTLIYMYLCICKWIRLGFNRIHLLNSVYVRMQHQEAAGELAKEAAKSKDDQINTQAGAMLEHGFYLLLLVKSIITKFELKSPVGSTSDHLIISVALFDSSDKDPHFFRSVFCFLLFTFSNPFHYRINTHFSLFALVTFN